MKKTIGALILLAGGVSFFIYAASPAPATSTPGNIHPGVYYQGGVVFWLDPAKSYKHGLIADIRDATGSSKPGYAWDTTPPSHTGATDSKLDAGKTNTQAIITAIGTARAQAASACTHSTSQGYSDWYLPSKDELALLIDQQRTIKKTTEAHGGQALSNSPYWSSTQFYANSAWSLSPNLGLGHEATTNKRQKLSVRCIRAF